MAALTNLIPISQIVFGTDYPFNLISVSGGPLSNLGLAPADLRAIERDNAVRMIPRLAA
jgi:predicted TIM-barrel fold metal-dependent hydrolase